MKLTNYTRIITCYKRYCRIEARKGFAFLLVAILLVISSNGSACDDSEQCIEENQWSIGLAIGAGIKTNPLVDGDNIPQVILFDIAWYSENYYFDNGELGIKWLEDDSFTASTYLSLDRERALFYFWDPANIALNIGQPVTDTGAGNELSINDIEKRNWALLAGSRVDYYYNNQKLSIAVEADVSGTHQGYRAELSYQKTWQQDDWRFHVRPFLIYKSDNLVDYYYGIDENDKVSPDLFYKGKGVIEPGVSFVYNHQLSAQWQFISSASYKKLGSGVRNSPIVNKNHQSSLFVGFGYRF